MVDGTIRPDRGRTQLGRIGVTALVSLLGVILAYAVVELVLSRRIESAEQVLAYDLVLEDATDEVSLAVLNVRERHLNLVDGPAPAEISDFERACTELFAHLDRLAEVGVKSDELPQPIQLRLVADRYYAEFRPAIESYGRDPAAFTEACDRGLLALAVLERQTITIDAWAEHDATETLEQVGLISETSKQALVLQ